MDVPADRSTRTAVAQPQAAVREAGRGAAAPAAHRGAAAASPSPPDQRVRWLVAMVVLLVLAVAAFSRGLQGIAIAVTVADDAVVRWLAGVDLPGFHGLLRGLVAMSSWWILNGVSMRWCSPCWCCAASGTWSSG
jgi:hypothetical protein